LNLDFTLGTLDDRITFTRATTATYFDKDGVLTSAASGEARFDYDPSTLAPRGLLIEEQRANLLTYSEDFANAAWTKLDCTATADAAVAPDGTLTSDKLIVNNGVSTTGGNSNGGVTQNPAGTTAIPYSYSFYAKAAEVLAVRVRETVTTGARANISLVNGSVVYESGSSSSFTVTTTNVGNGWWRIVLVRTPATTLGYVIKPGIDTGDGTSGIYLWGAQLEAGAFPTSYIPTTTTALTRNADVASMTGTNFSGWYNQSAGTFVVQSQQLGTGNAFIFTASDGTVNNRIAQFRNGTTLSNRVVTGGSATNPGDLTIVSQSLVSSAIAATAGSAIAAANGTLSSASTPVSLPTIDRLGIGVDNASATPLNGHIRRIAYYPTRLANAQLQALTA
jgi:hypothetical protein